MVCPDFLFLPSLVVQLVVLNNKHLRQRPRVLSADLIREGYLVLCLSLLDPHSELVPPPPLLLSR